MNIARFAAFTALSLTTGLAVLPAAQAQTSASAAARPSPDRQMPPPAVPEPSSLAALAGGVLGLSLLVFRARKKKTLA